MDLYWEESDLFVRSKTPWQKGQHYSLALEGSLRMADNRTYTVSLLRVFTYGDPGNEFTLVSGGIENGALIFVFSSPPLITSFNEKFTLSPFAEYHTGFNDNGKIITISPKPRWPVNTMYTWQIKDMVSAGGYLMQKEYSGLFSGDQDTEIPRLVQVCPVSLDPAPALWHTGSALEGALMEWQGIGFVFSKPMDEASVRSGISFYPSINGHFIKESAEKYIFVPEAAYQLQKEYRLTVGESVKDVSGLALFEASLIFFTTAGRFLMVESVTFDDHTAPMQAGGVMQEYTLRSAATEPKIPLATVINFSSAVPQANRRAAVDSVSLLPLFPASASSPKLLSAVWQQDGSRLVLNWESFTLSKSGIQYYYQLKISGGQRGAVNQTGEYLEEDLWIIFKAL
jgi:hypothetical protein